MPTKTAQNPQKKHLSLRERFTRRDKKPKKARNQINPKTEGQSKARLGISYEETIRATCGALIEDRRQLQLILRDLFKEVNRKSRPYRRYERAWILSLLYEKLSQVDLREPKQEDSEQLSAGPHLEPEERILRFQDYFSRLSLDQRFILILKEKHGVPVEELATAMQKPRDTLLLIWKQAMDSLEDWIWSPQ